MTPGTLWKTRDADVEATSWKLPARASDSSTPLAEDWKANSGLPNGTFSRSRGVKRVAASDRAPKEPASEPAGSEGSFELTGGEAAVAEVGKPRRFPASLVILRRLREERSPIAWSEAATTLKRDALRLRRSPQARHASVLLALADALTFTEPTDPMLRNDAEVSLQRAHRLLREPLVTEKAEEALLVDLLNRGWNLTPSAEEAAPEV